MVEWSITTVLKTVVLRGTGGSNPSPSAKKSHNVALFCLQTGCSGGAYRLFIDRKPSCIEGIRRRTAQVPAIRRFSTGLHGAVEYSFLQMRVYNRIHFHIVHTVIHNRRHVSSDFSELSTDFPALHMRYRRVEYSMNNS